MPLQRTSSSGAWSWEQRGEMSLQMSYLISPKVILEVVATFLLVFVMCGAASIYGADVTRVSQLGHSVVGGLIVTAVIYATGHISGANMNTAVTPSVSFFRHFPWIQGRVIPCDFIGVIKASNLFT